MPAAVTATAVPGRRVSDPSSPTRNALIMCVPPSSAYRKRLSWLVAMSVVCAAALYAAWGAASVSEPSLAIANVEIELLAAFAVKAQRPFLVTATQHAAACVVGADAVIRVSVPSAFSWYEDAADRPAAAPAASETTSSSRSPKAKPNGVEPEEAKLCAAPAAPV